MVRDYIVRTGQKQLRVMCYGHMRDTLFVLVIPTYKLVHTFRSTHSFEREQSEAGRR